MTKVKGRVVTIYAVQEDDSGKILRRLVLIVKSNYIPRRNDFFTDLVESPSKWKFAVEDYDVSSGIVMR